MTTKEELMITEKQPLWMITGPDPANQHISYDSQIGFYGVKSKKHGDRVWTDRARAIDIATENDPNLPRKRNQVFMKIHDETYLNHSETVLVAPLSKIIERFKPWTGTDPVDAQYPCANILPKTAKIIDRGGTFDSGNNIRLYQLPDGWAAAVAPLVEAEEKT